MVLPAFALFSTLQIACSSETSSSKKDDLSHEDGKPGGGYGSGTYDDDTGYD